VMCQQHRNPALNARPPMSMPVVRYILFVCTLILIQEGCQAQLAALEGLGVNTSPPLLPMAAALCSLLHCWAGLCRCVSTSPLDADEANPKEWVANRFVVQPEETLKRCQ
jgi:hypothetical protein